MFEFFRHNKTETKLEPETKTANTQELINDQEVVDNSGVELAYIDPEYEIAKNKINLDPGFFMTELDTALADVEVVDDQNVKPDFSDLTPLDYLPSIETKEGRPWTIRPIRQIASLGVALGFAFSAACNKTTENDHAFSPGVSSGELNKEGPISQKGPGEKFAKILNEVIPSGDVVNGHIIMNETTLLAISSGALVYDPRSNVFCVETMKDKARQGIPVETVLYYVLATKPDKEPRPTGGSLGGVKPFGAYTKGGNIATFDYNMFEKDIVASVDRGQCKNSKGEFDEGKYKKTIVTLKDVDFAMAAALTEWRKQNEAGRKALYESHVVPYLNRQ